MFSGNGIDRLGMEDGLSLFILLYRYYWAFLIDIRLGWRFIADV
jgi:hypothetical protein